MAGTMRVTPGLVWQNVVSGDDTCLLEIGNSGVIQYAVVPQADDLGALTEEEAADFPCHLLTPNGKPVASLYLLNSGTNAMAVWVRNPDSTADTDVIVTSY